MQIEHSEANKVVHCYVESDFGIVTLLSIDLSPRGYVSS